jgi:hypothetical protein
MQNLIIIDSKSIFERECLVHFIAVKFTWVPNTAAYFFKAATFLFLVKSLA